MKNISLPFTLVILLLATVFMAGCVSSPSDSVQGTAVPNVTSGNETSPKILIAYFSRTGNTETVAKMVAEETNGTLFRISTAEPYPESYEEILDLAQTEQQNNARPALSSHVERMDEYDIIYLGYPIWWGTMPMAVMTFLEEYDFTGKTIMPFCTSGGTGLGRSMNDIRAAVPEAVVMDGLALSGNSPDNAGRVAEWVAGSDIPNKSPARDMPKLRITAGDAVLTATLLDNPTARSLAEQLPLTVKVTDYAGAEKIFDVPRPLSTEDAPAGYDPKTGDIALYSPWGNVAVYYHDAPYAGGLVPIGSIDDDGVAMLGEISGDFSLVLEIME